MTSKRDLDISDWSKVRNIPHFDIIIHLDAKTFVADSFKIYAVMLAIKLENSGLQTFNLGTGKSYYVEEIVNLIIKNAWKKTVVKYTNEYWTCEVLDTIADIRKITTMLNWSPSIRIEKGINALLE